jgi:hypothetical protein
MSYGDSFFGGDGVPLNVNSHLGSFSYLPYCATPSLAVYSVYVTVVFIFFIVFCVIDDLRLHWCV